MESYYSDTYQYKSINSVLNSFSSDFFEGITMIVRPVIGGIDYLWSMHRAFLVQKELDIISRWNFEKRERFLDILTDAAAIDVYDDTFLSKLETKISEFAEFKETFEQLSQLTTRLNPTQRNEILKISLNKLSGKISSVRDNINLKMWDKNENVTHLMVLNQILYLIQELISETIRKHDNKILALIVYSLLKIEAFHRGKITFEDFQDYISELSLFDFKEKPLSKNYSAVFEALAV